MKNKNLYRIIFGFFSGYAVALVMLSREIGISTRNGAMTEDLKLFPFVAHYTHDDRAFPFLFPTPNDGLGEIKMVSSRRPFLNSIGISFNSYSAGDRLLAHQRSLLASYKSADFTKEERTIIANTYFKKLSESDRASAADYVQEVWEKAANAKGEK